MGPSSSGSPSGTLPSGTPPSGTATSTSTQSIPARAYAFLGCAAILFLLLLLVAFTWDCSGYISSLHADAVAAEAEQRNQEERVIAALSATGASSGDIDQAVTAYRAAASPVEKNRLFNGIVAAAGHAPRTSADVNDPLARRAADELAGAQNRRAIALRNRQEMITAYNAAAAGIRGSIGRRIKGLPERLD